MDAMSNTTTDTTSNWDIDTFMGRYMAMWNEPDATRRAAAVEELWVPDAVNATVSMRAAGHDEIVARVTRSFDAFVATGHRFEHDVPPIVHHGAARVTWRMLASDGTVAARGEEFLVLDEQGRIVSDHQFALPTTTAG